MAVEQHWGEMTSGQQASVVTVVVAGTLNVTSVQHFQRPFVACTDTDAIYFGFCLYTSGQQAGLADVFAL